MTAEQNPEGRGLAPDRTEPAPPPNVKERVRGAYLVVVSGFHLGALYRLPPGEPVVLGRADECAIRLIDDGISRRHAEVTAYGAQAAMTDLGSQNGCYLDGQRVTKAVLHEGAHLQLGFATTLRFTYADEVEADAQRKLAEAAVRDPLTGLYNRRHFEDRLAAATSGAQRTGRPLAVLILDLDHFKKINDRLGHSGGDSALVRLAQALRSAARRDEVVARIGGDEFGVIAEADQMAALALADHLRDAVAAAGDPGFATTLSIGVSVRPADSDAGPESLVSAADRALYRAKSKGRDRAEVEPPGQAVPPELKE